ncbi:MAG: family 78 glycoside hydrolase catalytic domain [Sedimentisphaerales bacterium]|nr:family 78 glycoside hydrolase catalytic domain [Sedimentisphaerales bacterium]
MLKMTGDYPFTPDSWPGQWVWAQHPGSHFEVVLFAKSFMVQSTAEPLILHITADNRYKLYVNGDFVGLGPQRGDLASWFFDTYDLTSKISPGRNLITVLAWHDRDDSPGAQISDRPGLYIAAQEPYTQQLSTGPTWKCRVFDKYRVIAAPPEIPFVGNGFDMPGLTEHDLIPEQKHIDNDYQPVRVIGMATDNRAADCSIAWRMRPRSIPALEADINQIGKIRSCNQQLQTNQWPTEIKNLNTLLSREPQNINGKSVTLKPNSHYRLIVDLGCLTNGYPQMTVSNGKDSLIRLTYQEALQSDPKDILSKTNRHTVKDKYILGLSDIFRPDGNQHITFEPLWYRCFRYIELDITTKDDPLDIEAFHYRYTGYPLKLHAKFETNGYFTPLVEPAFRTLRLCTNETFMDCPYYEQLQYLGDTRIQALLTYVLTDDDHLARQAIHAFGNSRIATGFTRSRYPCRVFQVIAPFSLYYISMLHDLLYWRGHKEFVIDHLSGVEAILAAYERHLKHDGLLGRLPNWSFVDWVNRPGWHNGAPPHSDNGTSYLINFLYLHALQLAADLYTRIGDSTLATKYAATATALSNVLREVAFNPEKKCFIDAPDCDSISQHTNIMAILTHSCQDLISPEQLMQSIITDETFAPTSYYFQFYLFEAMYTAGRADLIWPALKPFHKMIELGLTTFPETPEPTRSDCHAWSSHPLYHYFASIIGFRPTALACSNVSIKPAHRIPSSNLPAKLGGTLMTPKGPCTIHLRAKSQGPYEVTTELPPGVNIL